MELTVEKPKTPIESLNLSIEKRKTLLHIYQSHLDNTIELRKHLEEKLVNTFVGSGEHSSIKYDISKLEIEFVNLSEEVKYKQKEMTIWEARIPQLQAMEKKRFEDIAAESSLNYDKYLQIAKDNSEGDSSTAVIMQDVLQDIEVDSALIASDQAHKNNAYLNLKYNLLKEKLIQ